MIIFQDSDDKVVLPENSRKMAEINIMNIQVKNMGFVKKKTWLILWERESTFFKKFLKSQN